MTLVCQKLPRSVCSRIGFYENLTDCFQVEESVSEGPRTVRHDVGLSLVIDFLVFQDDVDLL